MFAIDATAHHRVDAEAAAASLQCRHVQKPRSATTLKRRDTVLEHASQVTITQSLDLPVHDPGNVIQRSGLINPRLFWQWFFMPDLSAPITDAHPAWRQRYDNLWSGPCQSELERDELMTMTAIPFVLRKRAAYVNPSNGDRPTIYTGELQALQALRRSVNNPRNEVRTGLIMAISWAIHSAIEHSDYTSALIHLAVFPRLVPARDATLVQWLTYTTSDLRVASVMSSAPVTERRLPSEVQHSTCRELLPKIRFDACQRFAVQNLQQIGALLHRASIYQPTLLILSKLHLLSQWNEISEPSSSPAMADFYHALYDSCALHASFQTDSPPGPQRHLLEMLCICLKLHSWEQAATFMPRCGEVEPRMLHLALRHSAALAQCTEYLRMDLYLWIIWSFTAAAYIFAEDFKPWIPCLQKTMAAHQLATEKALRKKLRGFVTYRWWWTRALPRISKELPLAQRWRMITMKDGVQRPPYHAQPLVFDVAEG